MRAPRARTTMFDDQTNRQEQHGLSDTEFGVYVRSVGTWASFSLMFRVTMLGGKGGGESGESLLSRCEEILRVRREFSHCLS
jgi:hypothetical protein